MSTNKPIATSGVNSLVLRRIEERDSPCSMGMQFRVVSSEGHVGPWCEGSKSLAWKKYKQMRKAQNRRQDYGTSQTARNS